MNSTRHTTTIIGILAGTCIGLSILFAVTRQDLQVAEEARRSCVAAHQAETDQKRQQLADTAAALKAAQYLAVHGDVQDYANRGEPSIRLCVPCRGDSRVLRVESCLPGEDTVVFPISYVGSDHHPELGIPMVNFFSL